MKKYIVRPGDTMWSISKRTGVRLNLLMAANPQYSSGSVLSPGHIVMIPELTKKKLPKPTSGTAAPPTAAVEATPVTGTSEPPSHHGYEPIHQAEPAPDYFGFVWPHVVRQGETWAGIAKQYGVSHEQLQQLNPTESPGTLNEGDVVYVPALGPVPGGTAAAPGMPMMPQGGMAAPRYAAPWSGGMMAPAVSIYPGVPGWPIGMMMPPVYPNAWPTVPARGFEAGWGWPWYGWADELYGGYDESQTEGYKGDRAGE